MIQLTARILKFTASPDSATIIPLPAGARVIKVAEQNHLVRFWMEVPFSAAIGQPVITVRRRQFVIMATGQTVDSAIHQYCGTALCEGGELVWHLYEVATAVVA